MMVGKLGDLATFVASGVDCCFDIPEPPSDWHHYGASVPLQTTGTGTTKYS